MQCQDALNVLNTVAPLHLAESWDKVGLQIQPATDALERALLCIDLTEAVAEEAVAKDVQLVVSYHPPIFQPLTALTDSEWKHRALLRLIRAGIGVYAPHTALDAVRGGVNDWLCDLIGPGTSSPIHPTGAKRDEYKVVVFVPATDEQRVRQAMSEAGAGWIGNYRECSFATPGEGGFRPLEGANPTIGSVGTRETVDERRMEMIVSGSYLAPVIAALREAHSYEEPAFDVFKLEPEPTVPGRHTGAGRLLALDEPITAAALRQQLTDGLGVPIKMGGAEPDALLRTVAVCPGAGGSLFESYEADAYVTGEMRHHQALDLVQRGKAVALAGHTNTERPYLPTYRDRLIAAGGDALSWTVSTMDAPPLVLQAD